MRYLILDTETTGRVENSELALDQQPQIIEFAGLIIDRYGQIQDQMEFLVKPTVKLGSIITKITGLKDGDLLDSKPMKDHMPSLKGFIESADAVVAHNLSYDWDIINFESRRLHEIIMWPMIRICTVQESEHYQGFRLSLAALHQHLFGEGFPEAHRAMNDVKALARCFVEMCKRGDL